jgi:hypothetical protein
LWLLAAAAEAVATRVPPELQEEVLKLQQVARVREVAAAVAPRPLAAEQVSPTVVRRLQRVLSARVERVDPVGMLVVVAAAEVGMAVVAAVVTTTIAVPTAAAEAVAPHTPARITPAASLTPLEFNQVTDE